ncbi:MAG: spore coat protein U domain-containing protein [Pseudomonadota bacterium]
MKTAIRSFAAVVVVAVASSSAFAASSTHDLAVSAQINGNCKFNGAGPTALTLANSGALIDTSLATDATGSATVPFRCTKGTTSAISAGNGLHFAGGSRNVDSGTETMAYSLALSDDAQVGTGHGAGQDLTLTVDGTIAFANHQNASAGTYTDTVVLTITP